MRVLEITGLDDGRASAGRTPLFTARLFITHGDPVGCLASVATPGSLAIVETLDRLGRRASVAVSLLVGTCLIAVRWC